MDPLSPLPVPTSADRANQAVRVIVASIPGVGGPLTEILAAVLPPALERRREAWLRELSVAIDEIRDRRGELFSPELLIRDESFVSALIHASQIAMRTHREEKIAALREAVVSSACAPEAHDITHLFISGARYIPRMGATER